MKKIMHLWVVTLLILVIVTMINVAPITSYAAETNTWDGTTVTRPSSTKTVDGVYYYEISKAEELAYIAKTGGAWLNYNYILSKDIILNSIELTYNSDGALTVDASTINQWTPINGFRGKFNGNGFSISGVYVDTNSSASGLFAELFGSVSNLSVTNSYIKGGEMTGGICGKFRGQDDAFINNCFYDGAVVGKKYVGGIAGSCSTSVSYSIHVENCGNYADIWSEGDYTGGITGSGGYTVGIKKCFNKGNITSNGNYTAGIVGKIDIGTWSIDQCVNQGNITGNNYVAGIVGHMIASYVTNCSNSGDIAGNTYIGGICGYGTNDDFFDTWAANIRSSYNIGKIKGTSNIGGIIGYAAYANLSNCYSIGNVVGNSSVGAIVGYRNVWSNNVSVKNCYYLKTTTTNNSLKGCCGIDDSEGITEAKSLDFFCINENNELNFNGHKYNSTCGATCDNCGYERENMHVFSNLLFDSESHWYECRCGKTNDKTAHSGGIVTCTDKAKCSVCGIEYGELDQHQYAFEWFTNKNEHWHECTCGAKTDVAEHRYDDNDICYNCGYEKRSAAIIIGIAVGSTAVVGIGGFSLFWFVIKKKSWADFLAIFKK